VVDVMRPGGNPMTGLEIALADKAPQATSKQAIDLQAAILAALARFAFVADPGEPQLVFPARSELRRATVVPICGRRRGS
jgi:hypothetical protein